MQRPVIEARGLRATVPLPNESLTLFENLDLNVNECEAVAILGRSGSGKSTLLAALGLMQRPETGELRIGGHDATSISHTRAAQLRNALVGFVFQSYSVIPNLTVLNNVALPLMYGQAVARKQARDLAMTALDSVGMADRASEKPLKLSGGEQQRVAIARALVRLPPIVLADEPTGALDIETARDVLKVLRDATTHAGSCLVVVTHDDAVAKSMDRALTLRVDGLVPWRPRSSTT